MTEMLDTKPAVDRLVVLNAIGTFGGGTIATVDALAKTTRLEEFVVQRIVHRLIGEGLVRAQAVREGFSIMAYSVTAAGRAEVDA